ncbi:MAG: hypothetical protein A3I61_11790 [Acidobacteria bacterium RIFCSPLOWO2_02_FULL_68_18]|nr:MAG: hypothetical protein A3I61_11790 [Acidobacteria bacterium RIFCSPLOWO2_02_FULL_68_18]
MVVWWLLPALYALLLAAPSVRLPGDELGEPLERRPIEQPPAIDDHQTGTRPGGEDLWKIAERRPRHRDHDHIRAVGAGGG